MLRMIFIVIGTTCGLLTACGAGAPVVQDPLAQESSPSTLRRFPLDLGEERGISGLDLDSDGRFWVVAEDTWGLTAFGGAAPARTYRVEPRIEDADLEGVVSLDAGLFALSTESTRERTADEVLIVRLDGDVARVEERLQAAYGLLGVTPGPNRGLEGVCYAGGWIVAAAEESWEYEGRRVAALFAWERATGRAVALRLALTSDEGKLSALTCEARGEVGLRVWAIERHYTVMRILEFDLDLHLDVPPPVIVPRLHRELFGTLEGDPNLEGLARDPGGFWIIVDNYYGERSGPNELIRLSP